VSPSQHFSIFSALDLLHSIVYVDRTNGLQYNMRATYLLCLFKDYTTAMREELT